MNRWEKAAKWNQNAVQRNADRILSDTHHDGLRTPRGLLLVSVAYVAITAGMAALWMFASHVGSLGLIAWIGALIALRLAVRSQADLPDEVLDERMRAERSAAYLHAYRVVALLLLSPLMVAFTMLAGREDGAVLALGYDSVNALFWSAMSLVVGAPSLVLAVQHSRRAK
jgi:hypothetical protein